MKWNGWELNLQPAGCPGIYFATAAWKNGKMANKERMFTVLRL